MTKKSLISVWTNGFKTVKVYSDGSSFMIVFTKEN